MAEPNRWSGDQLDFIGAKTLRDIYNQNGSRRINAPNCNPHLLNLLVDAPLKPLTQTEQTEQTEQTSHAVLQLMQIACACGLVNLLQMVPVGFEKKNAWKKATTVWQTPAIRSAAAQWEKLPHYAARMRDAFLSSQESENRHFIYNPTFRIKCSPHINAQYSKAAESRQPPNLMTTFQAWTEFEIQPTLAHTVGLGQLPWWMRWL